jgi:hypothetical protein
MWIKALVVLAGAGPAGEAVLPGTIFDFPDEIEARSLVRRNFAAPADPPADALEPGASSVVEDPPPDSPPPSEGPSADEVPADPPAKPKHKR